MIKEALAYVVGLRAPELNEIGGRVYTDKELYEVVEERYAKAIRLTTLTSLIEYIKSGVDEMKGKMFVHIESPTKVSVYSQLDYDRKRECVVEVVANLPCIDFNTFVEKEKFNIALQSKFIDSEERALLLKFAGTVEDGTVQEYGDDGVTQKATIKTGLASKSEAIVPNPVRLRPFRTFVEVEQPESEFVFRMKSDKYDGVKCALYEADGGVWQRYAMDSIKTFLVANLDVEGYTVIS